MIIFKIIGIVAVILLVLFILSLIVFFFNLDMKMAEKLLPLFEKHYNRRKKDRHL